MNMYNYFLKARASLRSLSSLVINIITQVAIVLELALVLSYEELAAVAAQLGIHSVHPRRRHGVLVAGRLQQGLELLDLGLEVAGVLLLAQAECALRDAVLVAPLLRWMLAEKRAAVSYWQRCLGQLRRGRLALSFSALKFDREDPPEVVVEFWHSVSIVGISGTRYVDIAHVLSEVELIDLSNLMSDYCSLYALRVCQI
jgi:hypothetical protein